MRARVRRPGPAQLLHRRRARTWSRRPSRPGCFARTVTSCGPARALLPDEPSVCATVWMDGTFCSQLTQGHVTPRRDHVACAAATSGSPRRTGCGSSSRTPRPGPDWRCSAPRRPGASRSIECRWWYAPSHERPDSRSRHDASTRRVRRRGGRDRGQRARRTAGASCSRPPTSLARPDGADRLGDAGDGRGSRSRHRRTAPPPGCIPTRGSVRLGWTRGSAHARTTTGRSSSTADPAACPG